MTDHTFTLILDREPTDTDLDALFEAGCDDALFGSVDGAHYAEFDREAPTFVEALTTAFAAIHQTGLRVVRIEPDDLVTAAEIAERTGRSRESIRLLAAGRRGDGSFPAPIARATTRAHLWRWSDVATAMGLPVAAQAALVAALNARLELATTTARLDEPTRAALDHISLAA